MDITSQVVIHKMFGEGTVIKHEGDKITISFDVGEKTLQFPKAFKDYLTAKDTIVSEQINQLLKDIEEKELLEKQEKERQWEEEKQKRMQETIKPQKTQRIKSIVRENVAFKCNFCDGGQSENQVGYEGVCSDSVIQNNIEKRKHIWCCNKDYPCYRYLNNEISRKELEEEYLSGKFICYESKMLSDWKAYAGEVQSGAKKGEPMKMKSVQNNSLCVLSTRDPESNEEDRYIFAVFLVDETYEGDSRIAGYVTTKSKYKIKLSPKEARSILFWNYHANENKPREAKWSSGLHRYFKDEQAAQILRDISKVKVGTSDELLAKEFFEVFCNKNNIDISTIGELQGALQI
jgi:hypothetical protein